MAFTGTAVIPPGDLLVHVQQWTSPSTVQLLGLMRGASPISGGDSAQQAALVAAHRADAAARAALDEDLGRAAATAGAAGRCAGSTGGSCVPAAQDQ
jgi:hypothetical protein